MSHGHCYLWLPGLIRLHLLSDLIIGGSYVAISATLVYLVRRTNKDIPFSWMFWNLLNMDFGFDRDHVLSGSTRASLGSRSASRPGSLHTDRGSGQALPGVQSAAMPLYRVGGGTTISGIHVPGYVPKPLENMSVQENSPCNP